MTVHMGAEERAREIIDRQLKLAGWVVQDMDRLNLGASAGVAVREFPLTTGFADYLLFVDRKAVGAVEAKPVGTTLSGVAEQSEKYLSGVPENIPQVQRPLPFAYESTGSETFFRDSRDPEPRSRRVFNFHCPETFSRWLEQNDTLRARLRQMPAPVTDGFWTCQVEAMGNLEKSLVEAKPRALIQMATGSGKTFTAVSSIYRLIKFADASRVLFLVDRSNLGRQTKKEFQQYITPDDGRKFTELYNVQHLTSNTLDPVSRVCITTIQRLYSMLKGEAEFDPSLEEQSGFETAPEATEPLQVVYNRLLPVETFDFVITDECHRSIYNLWRQVLEYFDAFIIGLTATPSKQTFGFFNQNLVMEYGHDRAVADGVNVGYDVYRIKTEITEQGSKVEAGYYIDKRDKLTRQVRWEVLEDDVEYAPAQLDRDVVAPDQIRTIIRTFRDKLFTEIFPGRREVPKTLVFAKDDSHAEDIVHIIREEFGKGNEFCKKITYKTYGEKPEDLIAAFRNSYNPRIAVTVDMISTGTDIRPLECLLFMREIKSRVYFEQAKGRGTRTISQTEFQAVTPDARNKTHFVIVDAVGVCENDKTDSRPLERKRSVSFDRLIDSVALGVRDPDTLSSLAGRLARLDRAIDPADRQEISETADGIALPQIVGNLLNAVDPDHQAEKAREIFDTDVPSEKQLAEAAEKLIDEACRVFDNPDLRRRIKEIKRKNEQLIDTVSRDKVIFAGYDAQAREKARTIVDSFRNFIEENKDEITALQIIYSMPYGRRKLTFKEIELLARAIEKPPYGLTSEQVWTAYGQLDKSKVRGAGPGRLLTDIISLVRFAMDRTEILQPFAETAGERFDIWLEEQEKTGRSFTEEQLEWLHMIRDHIATSLEIEKDDFELAPFHRKGGLARVHTIFGEELEKILQELNEVLVA